MRYTVCELSKNYVKKISVAITGRNMV